MDPETILAVAFRRRRSLTLLDLPLQVLETIALRVAASPLHVTPLPSSGLVSDGCHAFLGDHPVAFPPDQISAGRSLWLFGINNNNRAKQVSSRLASMASTRLAPSSVLTLDALTRLGPFRATCRRLNRAALQAVTGVDVGFSVDSMTTVLVLRRLWNVRTVLASDPWECGHVDCFALMDRDDVGVPLCDAMATHEDTLLLHEALVDSRVNSFAYRGKPLPVALVRSLAAESTHPLRRLSLQCSDPHYRRVGDVLRVHADTLEELSLLLCLDKKFFSRLLARGSRGDGTDRLQFPALRALCLLRRHPVDVAKLVAASPSLSAVRFVCGLPLVSTPSGDGWALPLIPVCVGDVVPMLETALAPAAGRGLLTSLELDSDRKGGVSTMRDELAGLALLQETLRSLSVACYYDDDWASCPNISWHFPALRSLSLFLHFRCDFAPFLQQLCSTSSTCGRFPLLSDLHIETTAAPFSLAGRPLRVRMASAVSQRWASDLPSLKRLHLRCPLAGIAVALCSLSSASLEALSLSATDRKGVLPTAALSDLPSRCPVLHAVRVEGVRLDPSFPATLALWGLVGHYVACTFTSHMRMSDEVSIRATQFM